MTTQRNQPMSLSIIIPNTNSPQIGAIVRTLKQQAQALTAVEILVVGIDEPGLVATDEQVQFIATTAPYAAAKRNLGIQVAQGDILLFLDDDCLPLPGFLAQHLWRQQQGQAVVGGAVTFGRANYLQLADNVSAFHDLLPCTAAGSRSYLAAANLSVRRSVIEQVGLMIESLRRAEDLEWTVRMRRLGYLLYFDPKAVIYHNPERRTWAKLWAHWVIDAPDTLRVRLQYAHSLATPRLAHHQSIYMWGALFIAGWATLRTFMSAAILRHYWPTLPLVYLTKLAWCWGAFRHFPYPSPRQHTSGKAETIV